MIVARYGGSLSHPQFGLCNSRIFCSSEPGVTLRRRVLNEVDNELSRGDERAALSLVKELQGKPGGLRCFGAARQIPQRLYSLDELKLNGIETVSLLSPVDSTLGSIERILQLAAISGWIAAWNILHLNPQQILFISLGLMFLWTFDSHEAGHFLIAYLLGVLPKGYTLTSLEAFKKEGSLNVQAGTAFVDFEFIEEVNKGQVSATMLNRFSCIALAGVATEYLLFGCAEGGLADINQGCEWLIKKNPPVTLQLDMLLRSLGFTQKKTDSQVRWAVLNTIIILRRHDNALAKLAEVMSEGRSVGSCIDTIEENISDDGW
ncbi:unnamed protein product [Cuscuta epithymum]|uniref:Uncharacterized protein n=1 Tax=Cuscuta epithymum TaxID=186058 RepID=A0AAV0GBC0_9ASTE|nr:unnamed protein product [Cuscuta epithymum]